MGSVGGGDDLHTSVKSSDEGRIKFLCSYGGKILPKPDGQLRYVGGDTRLVSLHRNIGYAELMIRLEKLFGSNLLLKYQLPNEDLDTLISVTSDEDVENLMEEYDRNEGRDGASRLRAFLFPSAGLPPRASVSTYADQVLEEVPKSPRIHADHIVLPPPVKLHTEPYVEAPSGAFKVPDFLFGFDNTINLSPREQQPQHHYYSHNHQPQQHHQRQQQSQQEMIIDKSSGVPSQRLPRSAASQAEFVRQQAITIDSGGRGPALTTSALGPLVSSNQHLWETGKVWDDWIPGEHHIERHSLEPSIEKHHPAEVNTEASYILPPRDAIAGSGMPRVQSKDRMFCTHTEGSHGETHAGAEHQDRMQALHRTDRHNVEDAHPDARAASPFTRQESASQGAGRLYKATEVHRNTQLGMAAHEIQRGVMQPTLTGFDLVSERSGEGRRNSGGSDEGAHQRRIEGYGSNENASHLHSNIAMNSGPSDGFKFQDAMEVHRSDDLHQQKHGEFEVLPTMLSKHEAHVHHLGKGHFQQVHWQLHDSQEPQQLLVSSHEPLRLSHNLPASQRQPHNYHLVSSGIDGHHHRVPSSSNMRAIPRSDTMPHSRVPSSMYMQAGIGGASRPEPQQLPRAPSPLRDHPTNNGPNIPPRYGNWAVQMHEMGYLPPGRGQQTSGIPSGQVFVDSSEGYAAHDTSAHDVAMSQVQYLDKVIMANQAVGKGPVHFADDNLQVNP